MAHLYITMQHKIMGAGEKPKGTPVLICLKGHQSGTCGHSSYSYPGRQGESTLHMLRSTFSLAVADMC